ncbi:hypothetical protein ACYJ1Y_17480 [Natrialbaceae archaeon A-gly3]
MDDSTLEFAEEATADWESINKYEKAEDIHYGFFFLSLISLGICWYFRDWFTSTTVGHIPYNEYSFLLLPIVFLFISIIGWRAKRNTNMTQSDLSLHYFGHTILNFNNNRYKKATEYLEGFETRATRSSNDLFTNRNKERITSYVERFDDDTDNESVFDETFVEFANAIIDEVDSDHNLDELIKGSVEENMEKASTADIISEGLGGLPLDRFVFSQLITVIIALYVFYNIGEQLGMFMIVSLLPIIQYIKNTQN